MGFNRKICLLHTCLFVESVLAVYAEINIQKLKKEEGEFELLYYLIDVGVVWQSKYILALC